MTPQEMTQAVRDGINLAVYDNSRHLLQSFFDLAKFVAEKNGYKITLTQEYAELRLFGQLVRFDISSQEGGNQ